MRVTRRPPQARRRSEEQIMATFISLLNFTDQGIRNVKDSPDRYDAFRGAAEQLGVKVTSIWWTVGSYDLVATLEGPEEAVTSLLLKLGSLGNVRTQTLRGYSQQEMRGLLAKIP
jgi:uncharacterized protein with GYD domain